MLWQRGHWMTRGPGLMQLPQTSPERFAARDSFFGDLEDGGTPPCRREVCTSSLAPPPPPPLSRPADGFFPPFFTLSCFLFPPPFWLERAFFRCRRPWARLLLLASSSRRRSEAAAALASAALAAAPRLPVAVRQQKRTRRATTATVKSSKVPVMQMITRHQPLATP